MSLGKTLSRFYRFWVSRRPQGWKKSWSRLNARFLSWMTKHLIKKSPAYYSADHLGSDAPCLLALKNLLRPDRFLLKAAYGQWLPLPDCFLLSERNSPDILLSEEIRSWVKTFKSDGFVILPGYLQQQIQGLAERYSATPRDQKQEKELTVRYLSLLDEAFPQIVLHEVLLSALAQILGCQPFIQDFPVITVVNTLQPSSAPPEKEAVTEWHSDNVNTLKILVFLNDVTKEGVRMLIAKGSHRPHRISLSLADSLYSDAYVRSKYEVVDCVGPKGTVVIFDANALHKQLRTPRSFRSMLAVKYSPGNGFNFLRKQKEGYFESRRAEDIFREIPLSSIQQRALKGLLEKPS